LVLNRVLLFAFFPVTMLASDAPCHAVLRGSFAIPFANMPASAYSAEGGLPQRTPACPLMTQSGHPGLLMLLLTMG
jgi:hypothetical protein